MNESRSFDHSILDHLFAAFDIGVTHFTACDIRDGWGVGFEACKTASLHYCLEGTGTLVVGGTAIALTPHTFVLLTPETPYRIDSATVSSMHLEHRARLCGMPSRESVPAVTVGEGSRGIFTVCGELGLGTVGGSEPFILLGQPLVVRFGDDGGLRDKFIMILAESTRPGIGSRALIEALLKQCLILALRRQIELGNTDLPWLAGITDARLGRALRTIFEKPFSSLTVERLASIAGMSRSAFAARFTQALGRSPMSLVRIVRLRHASDLLATTALPVADIAKRVGFSSRSNFSQAFEHFYGQNPSQFRRSITSVKR